VPCGLSGNERLNTPNESGDDINLLFGQSRLSIVGIKTKGEFIG
jgi:hypothetical protein